MNNANTGDMARKIQLLRAEAGEAGDLEMVEICDRALDGDRDAISECARVMTQLDSSAPGKFITEKPQ